MKPIYEKLYNYDCDPILRQCENFDEYTLKKQFAVLHLDEGHHRELMDILFELHHQWSLDGFATGLHLGLSLRPRQRLAKRKARKETQIKSVKSPVYIHTAKCGNTIP